MSTIYLTELGRDNFQRANENPLSQGGKWTENIYGDHPLQVVSDVCEVTATSGDFAGMIYSGVALPNDQYASVTFATAPPSGSDSYLAPCIRFTDGGDHFEQEPSYLVYLTSVNWQITWGAYNNIANGALSVSAGDTFTFAVIGSSLYLYQNTTLLWSGTDATYASGGSALASVSFGQLSDCQCSYWSVGSASLTQTDGSFTPGNNPAQGNTSSTTGGESWMPKYNTLRGRTVPAQESPLKPFYKPDILKKR